MAVHASWLEMGGGGGEGPKRVTRRTIRRRRLFTTPEISPAGSKDPYGVMRKTSPSEICDGWPAMMYHLKKASMFWKDASGP